MAFQNDAFQVCPAGLDYIGSFLLPSRSAVAKGLAVAIAASGLIANPFTPTAEAVTIDKWLQPLSEPVRVRTLATAHQQAVAPSDLKPIVSFGWNEQSLEPVRQKPGLRADLQQFAATPPVIEEITVDKWFNPFSEPRRFRLSVPQQQFIAQDVLADSQLTDTFESRWHQPWSEPVRLKPGLRADLQKVTDIDPFPRPTAQNFVSNWYIPLSEPVRQKPELLASLQQFFTIDPYILTQPEQVSEDKWHEPWSEPVRQKQGLGVHLQSFIAPDPFPRPTAQNFVSNWFIPLTEPVRLKIGLRANLQQFLAIDPYILTQPERVSEDRWHQPWSEPVRQRRGLAAYLQKTTDINPFPRPAEISIATWFQGLSEPVRLKIGLRSSLQRIELINPLPPVVLTTASWYIPLAEPVRLPKGLRPSLQQAFTIDPFILTRSEAVTEDRWHQPWSEPVRLPRGLKAWLQTYKASTDGPEFIPDVTVTLNATEVNGDIFIAGIYVFSGLPVRRALVSIVEVPIPGNDPVSIRES